MLYNIFITYFGENKRSLILFIHWLLCIYKRSECVKWDRSALIRFDWCDVAMYISFYSYPRETVCGISNGRRRLPALHSSVVPTRSPRFQTQRSSGFRWNNSFVFCTSAPIRAEAYRRREIAGARHVCDFSSIHTSTRLE